LVRESSCATECYRLRQSWRAGVFTGAKAPQRMTANSS
jgi:hypothetical protein